MIPETVIEQIRNRADIVDVIREVVPLKKAGRLWRGLCPFHQEKDASFTVYQDKQIFKCFGCQRGGNVFGFVMQYFNLEFPEAVRHLGGRYAIDVPEAGGTPGATGKREEMYTINEIASQFFSAQLKKAGAGSQAGKYLLEKRKLERETITQFELGFAPDTWDSLLKELQKRKVPIELAVELGLIVEKDQRRHYDRFRNRVMFTLRSPAGKIIGFSGRLMEDGEPKYLNSPESLVFNKGSQFFGLNLAGQQINKKQRAIICEGNFDLVVMHQYGFPETVAVLGSALTERHVSLLGRYSSAIYLLFDGDKAGMKAMWRSLELFLPSKIHPQVVLLPDGQDPDSFLADQGAKKLEELLDQAPLAMDFAVARLMDKAGDNVERQTRAIDEIGRLLRLIEDPVRQDHYIRAVAERSGVREGAIRKKLSKTEKWERRPATKTGAAGAQISQLPDTVMMLLVVAILEPKLANRIESQEIYELIDPGPQTELAIKALKACAKHSEKEKPNPARYLSLFEGSELSSRLTDLLLQYEEMTPANLEDIFVDTVRRMKIARYNRSIPKLMEELAKAQKENDKKRLIQIHEEIRELNQMKEEIAEDFHRLI